MRDWYKESQISHIGQKVRPINKVSRLLTPNSSPLFWGCLCHSAIEPLVKGKQNPAADMAGEPNSFAKKKTILKIKTNH